MTGKHAVSPRSGQYPALQIVCCRLDYFHPSPAGLCHRRPESLWYLLAFVDSFGFAPLAVPDFRHILAIIVLCSLRRECVTLPPKEGISHVSLDPRPSPRRGSKTAIPHRVGVLRACKCAPLQHTRRCRARRAVLDNTGIPDGETVGGLRWS